MVLPENACGRPVREDSFFGRKADVERLWRRLETDHVLLTAPRRVGKTSVMYAMAAEAAHRREWCAGVYFSAEDTADEAAFIAGLYATIARAPGCEHVAAVLTQRQRKSVIANVAKIGVGPLTVELWQQAKDNWMVLAAEFEEALSGLPPGRRLLLMVDELPVFLLKLSGEAPERAQAFLAWFRALRQGRPERSDDVRWLLAGSIGLGPLASRAGWTALINDLHPASIGAFDPPTAAALVAALSDRYKLGLGSETVEGLVGKIGWPIPYFLQLMVAELREQSARPVEPAQVDAAFDALLTTNVTKNFGPWWERLGAELGATDASAAAAVLTVCAADPAGASATTIRGALDGFWAEAERDAHRRGLLEVLEHDGYLVDVDGRWAFRSPLLRAVWLRRERR